MPKSQSNPKKRVSVACQVCGVARCCRDGVEVDLFEVAHILKIPLDIPKPWFVYLGRDKRFPSGYKFSTLLRDRRCVFQREDLRCLIYENKPRLCAEFPMEGKRVAPYYVELCHHARTKKKKKKMRRSRDKRRRSRGKNRRDKDKSAVRSQS